MKVKNIKVTRFYQDLPDVDCDFPTYARDKVKEYIKSKYGYAYSCSVATFTSMKLKTCLKDFAKVKGIPFDIMNKLTKDIDDQLEYTWQDLLLYASKSKALFKFIQENPDLVHLTKYALNQRKAGSVHPSAVIIVPKMMNGEQVDLFKLMPVKQMDGMLVSEWEGKYTESALFLKEDVLGLSQLDKFQIILRLIKKNQGKDVDVTEISFDDAEVFRYFQKGWCEDVFQFGTTSLMNYCKQLKPTQLSDLIAATALFRPGPIASGSHQDFVDIKHGKKKPKYDYGVKNITEETYSLLVYQEQMMAYIRQLGGMSFVDAENVRTYIKKKKHKELDAMGERFLQGAINNGCPENEAKRIWDKMNGFSKYSFNKCIAGSERILKVGHRKGGYRPTIAEMYKIKNDVVYAKSTGHLNLCGKYRREGYGMCFSKDGLIRCKRNKIVDIRYQGIKPVYKVITEHGESIRVTLNHKFPTTKGEKKLSELKIGDKIFILVSYQESTPDEKDLTCRPDKIISIEFDGEEDVYDVEVSGDISHTFVTEGGVVTSNSHAAAYTVMSYWSMWFKVNYPLEFWTACLQESNESEIPYRLAEMKKTGVKVEIRPPDINQSTDKFACDPVENRIFFNLNKIKGVGDVAVKAILTTRQEGGLFFSLEEFLSRVPSKVNKSVVKWLIIAGAFDLVENIRQPLERRKLLEKYLIEIKGDEELPAEYRGVDARLTNAFWIFEQKRLTGFGDVDYESLLKEKVSNHNVVRHFMTPLEFNNVPNDTKATVVGKLLYYVERDTKNGKMCQLQLDCNNDILLCTLWADVYDKIGESEMFRLKNRVIAINGIVKKDKFKQQKVLYSEKTTKLYEIG